MLILKHQKINNVFNETVIYSNFRSCQKTEIFHDFFVNQSGLLKM